MCAWVLESANSIISVRQSSAGVGRGSGMPVPLNVTTALGRRGVAALEAYVSMGITPEVFCVFFWGWLPVGVLVGGGVAFWVAGFCALLTALDSAVMVSLMPRISWWRVSILGGFGGWIVGLNPRILIVVGDVRNEV